jgi:hypothetical protein
VIFQNLWAEYGIVFRDRSLLYGALVWMTASRMRQEGPALHETEYCIFKSRLHDSLVTAIRHNTISESHFFALAFAVLGTGPSEGKYIHIKGLLDVLELLNQQHVSGLTAQPLRYLYHYVLSFLRRNRSIFGPPELENELRVSIESVTEACNSPDDRVTHRSLRRLPTFPGYHIDPLNVKWSLMNDIQNLMAIYACGKISTTDCHYLPETTSEITTNLRCLRSSIMVAQGLPELSSLFESVRPPSQLN